MRGRRAHPVWEIVSAGAVVLVMGCEASPNPGAVVVAPVEDVPGRPGGEGTDGAVQALRLDDMNTERADPTPERRNPFRFGATRPGPSRAAPPVIASSPSPVRRDAPPRDEAAVPSPPGAPVPPSIPLTFMGFMESPGVEGRVVVLSDGDAVFHGRRGDVIDGRYRILNMGLESVELERIDGRGRATLRLPNDVSDGL